MVKSYVKINVKKSVGRIKDELYKASLIFDFNSFNRLSNKLKLLLELNPKKKYLVVDRCHSCKQIWINPNGTKILFRYSELLEDNYSQPTVKIIVKRKTA